MAFIEMEKAYDNVCIRKVRVARRREWKKRQ